MASSSYSPLPLHPPKEGLPYYEGKGAAARP